MSELLADKNGFHPPLEAIFTFTYPKGLEDVTLPRAIPRPPLEFHDRHVDPSLTLQCVKYLGFSLVDYLSSLCEDEITAFVQKENSIRSPEDSIPQPPPLRYLYDAFDVARYYVTSIANITTPFPSNLYLRPPEAEWEESLLGVDPPTRPPDFHDVFRAETAVSFMSDESMEELQLPLDDDLASELKYLGEKHPEIAIYEMFAFSEPARKLIREMGPRAPFRWKTPDTQGYSIGPSIREYPTDAATGLWPKVASISPPKKLSRSKGRQGKAPLSSKPATVTKPQRKGATVRTAPLAGTRQRPYRPEEVAYLQHAWSRAVQNDATFIIFHCGKYERIGFRHRKTQTLYLSELIDPSVQEYYGKVQIGLQLAIMKDLLERREIEKRQSLPGQKRPTESHIHTNKKRQKIKENVTDLASDPSTELVEEALGSRDLALFNLDYEVFRSPTPSSFIRVTSFVDPMSPFPTPRELKKKASYAAPHYFSLCLGQHLATGAIGTVHRASATFISGSKTFKYSDLVVKVAFTEENQERLRHEYTIYRHLAAKGFTENILRVYGLFQDAETGVLAIVMDYGGTPLTSREVEGSEEVPCTTEEKIAFSEALRKLHGAGVFHGDIRSNNLLIDSSNNVYFIDFHRSAIHLTPEHFEGEEIRLALLLGCYDTESDDDNPHLDTGLEP